MIPDYPDSTEVAIDLRPVLHPLLKGLSSGVSEFTFANIYLFRNTHSYRLSRLAGGLIMVEGKEGERRFFMLPWGLPEEGLLRELLSSFSFMKNASPEEARALAEKGLKAVEDRGNFDYLYSRAEQASLSGRRFHRKKNLVNSFLRGYSCEARPMGPGSKGMALSVLDGWREESGSADDYEAAREALQRMEELELSGRLYYIDGNPSAYIMGEELTPDTYVVHFEKGLKRFKGLFQFANMEFAASLPERFAFINREQDLGDEGLRKSKTSYRPVGFVRKYRVFP